MESRGQRTIRTEDLQFTELPMSIPGIPGMLISGAPVAELGIGIPGVFVTMAEPIEVVIMSIASMMVLYVG